MRKAPLFLTLIASLMFLPAAQAKNRDKSWEFGAAVGHMDADGGSGIENSVGPLIRAGYHFSAALEAELSLSSTSTDVDGHDADFLRAMICITGNFLTDHETATIPYVTAGLGVINETIKGYTDKATGDEILESFDSAAILTLGVGARTFFSENWGIRYEARYNHQNSFDQNQDEYVVSAGVTWIVGGQK